MYKWNFFTTNEIKPQGWLKRQLHIQASGLSGSLDKMWRDVKSSGWIGGNGESWERFPYWLDGYIPLAYLLDDEEMIANVRKHMDYIFAHQRPDGWICPCADDKIEEYNTWALILFTKVLVVYYECSRDERAPKVLYDVLKNYYTLLESGRIKLFITGRNRWFECFIAINFMYERTKEEWLLKLANILRAQGAQYLESLEAWEHVFDTGRADTHIVNISQAIRCEALTCDILGEEYQDMAEIMYDKLYKYHGTPVGMFTGDEHLSGLSPIQGTELCSVVELMYSFEHLYARTGDPKWAERLEMVALNALPAGISDDMWTHQYDQMSNQIACIRFPDKPIFKTNCASAHLFGLEPHYGCCTANFNQGWPKFTLSAFMHNDESIINALPVPSMLDCDTAYIKLETEYPFKNSFKYIIEAKKDFEFYIRIPSFAKNAVADGKAVEGDMLKISLTAGESREICLTYEAVPCFVERPHGLNTVKCGSLIFSLPIKYEKKMYEYGEDVPRRFPYCDYEYIPISEWNYAYSDTDLEVVRREIDEIPFSSKRPPIMIRAKVKPIDWGYEEGYGVLCKKVPNSREPIGDEREVLLYPYGAAKLRMTELPLIN